MEISNNNVLSKSIVIKSFILLSVIITVVVMEALTRDFVFNSSLAFEKSLQSGKSNTLTTIFKIISGIGDQHFYIPALFLIFLFYPIQRSFLFFFNVSISVLLVEILKNSYGNPRPFWIEKSLFKVCEGGYGNPSGHSISATAGFLGIWTTIFDNEYFDEKKIWKYLSLFTTVTMIFLILLSRLYLAAHSINQVFYGASLGLGIYTLLYVILKAHKMDTVKFYQKIFLEKKYKIIFSVIFFILFLIILLVYFFKKNEYIAYEYIFNTICSNVGLFKRFNYSGLGGGFVLFTIAGGYYGVIFVLRYVDENICLDIEASKGNIENPIFIKKLNMINNWNKTSWGNFLIILVVMVGSCFPCILKSLIPNTVELWVYFTFKTAIPLLFLGFGIWGLTIYFSFYFELSNKGFEENSVMKKVNNYFYNEPTFKKVDYQNNL